MSIGIQRGEPDPKIVYAEIINSPHWEPKQKHPRMRIAERAAQFSPFAALSGYDEMIDEETRLVDRKIELSEEEQNSISLKLSLLSDMISFGSQPAATITWFVPDPRKAGGKYETATEKIRRIDAAHGKVILARTMGYAGSYMEIEIRDILEIRSEALAEME